MQIVADMLQLRVLQCRKKVRIRHMRRVFGLSEKRCFKKSKYYLEHADCTAGFLKGSFFAFLHWFSIINFSI